jgi:hypothetical protein
MAWIYRKTEANLWTVGTFIYSAADQGTTGRQWYTDSDHENREDAAARCNYLNGGTGVAPKTIENLSEALVRIADRLENWSEDHSLAVTSHPGT